MAGTPPPRPRRSEVDFADVFGGPPRRSSGHDHLRRGSADLWCALPRTRSSSGGAPGERPVFGERTSSDRRRQPGNEFYNDIFPGSESACPSPRPVSAGDWDVFGDPASPGSMSRSRSSFSLKFTIGMDNSMPTSPSQHAANRNNDGTSYAYSVPSSPNSSTNSFLARGLPSQHSMRNPFSFHRFPFQSRLRSQCGDKKNATNYVSSMDSECEGTPVSLESYINNKFHFSFYKWARKGASLMLPATAQEKGAKVVRLRSFPQVVVQGIDFIDDEDNMSTATGASKSQTDYKDRKSVTKHGADDAKANVITASPSTQSSQSPSGQKSHGNRIKGKVKDFIKMFNPEGSPKRKGTPESQDQISSGKYGSKGGGQDFVSISSSEANEDVKSAQTNYENTFSTAASPINEAQEKEAPVLKVDSEMQESTEKFSENKATTTASSDESTHDVSKDKASNTIDGEESHVEDLEACVVEHFSEEQYSVLHNDQEKDQIKISESKICEWSKGKQGNIRSLLSTLQYVLWPESGWKPVPLVDIIEGAAVKKAYQRALLCLHPDKLQQRGAAVHHKYIAAKVFDILQEAWAEFNSVTFG